MSCPFRIQQGKPSMAEEDQQCACGAASHYMRFPSHILASVHRASAAILLTLMYSPARAQYCADLPVLSLSLSLSIACILDVHHCLSHALACFSFLICISRGCHLLCHSSSSWHPFTGFPRGFPLLVRARSLYLSLSLSLSFYSLSWLVSSGACLHFVLIDSLSPSFLPYVLLCLFVCLHVCCLSVCLFVDTLSLLCHIVSLCLSGSSCIFAPHSKSRGLRKYMLCPHHGAHVGSARPAL